jgi:NADH:ubiquinone reductase (H+-translocating)
VNPARKLLRHTRFLAAEVEKIDLEKREVIVAHGFDRHLHAIQFDHLVLGLGNVTDLRGVPGLSDHALTMKTLGDAMRLRNHLIAHLEEADSECCKDKDPHLAFVVAGGGFAGVETIAAINDFVRGALKSYPNLSERMVRMILVHSGAMILPELKPELGAYAAKKLGARKVEILLNTKVEKCEGGEVHLNNGTSIRAQSVVWTAGAGPNPLIEGMQCHKERGRILVTEALEVKGRPGVWALGDCAAVADSRTGGFHPPTAQHAIRQASVVAHNVIATVRGKGEKKQFRFSTIGQLATIGRRIGVANLFGVNFSGFIAWWMWRTIYLAKLPRVEKKLRVAFDWTLDLLFAKDFVQYFDVRAPEAGRSEMSSSHPA